MEIYFLKGGVEIVYNHHSHENVIITYEKLLNNNNIVLELKKYIKTAENNLYIGIIETDLEFQNLILDLNEIKHIKYIELENFLVNKKNFFNLKLNFELEHFKFTREGFNAISDIKYIKKYINTIIFNISVVDLNKFNKLFNKNTKKMIVKIANSKIKGKIIKNIEVKKLYINNSKFLDSELKIENNNAGIISLSYVSLEENLYVEKNKNTVELYDVKTKNIYCSGFDSKLVIDNSNIKKLIAKNILFININNSNINKTVITGTKNVIIKNLFSFPNSKIFLVNNETVVLKFHYETKFRNKNLFLKNIKDLILFLDLVNISIEIFDIILNFFDKIYKQGFKYNIKNLYIDDQSITNFFQSDVEKKFSGELKNILLGKHKIINDKDIENLVLDIFKIYNKYNKIFPKLKNIQNTKIPDNFKQNLLKI